MYGNLSITTATSEINETVESMSRFLTTNRNIELLEPYEGKLSRTVLRGEGGSNALDLPDNKLLKSMLLDVILYTVLTIFSIILFFTYINPIIRENISGIKGALLSLSIILAVILPFLWAIITGGHWFL